MVIDSSIHEKVNCREEFNILEEGKELHSLKTIRINDKTPITLMSHGIFNRDLRIDEWNKKREKFGNDIFNIKRHKFKLKEILKEGKKLEIEQSFVYKIEYVHRFKCIILNEKLGLVVIS